MGSNPLFRLRIDRLRSCARRAAPSAAERRLLENLRQKIKSLDVNFLGKTIRAECIIGAYEAYSSRSVHSHLNLERLEWWHHLGPQKTATYTPPRTQGTSPWARRRPPECAGILKAYFFAASAPSVAIARQPYLTTISFRDPSQLDFCTQLDEIYRLGQGPFWTSGRPRVTYLVLAQNDPQMHFWTY